MQFPMCNALVVDWVGREGVGYERMHAFITVMYAHQIRIRHAFPGARMNMITNTECGRTENAFHSIGP